MKKKSWKIKIKNECKAAGTYQPFFDSVIDTLADILAKRDEAQELYESTGGKAIVKHTNKSGATNLEQNPCLRLINDLNRDALTYWKECGLTARAWKDTTGEKIVVKKTNSLAEALKSLG